MDLRETQRPLKERYREDPGEAQITLSARGGSADEVVACSVDLGRAIQEAQAHPGVGGAGTGACSGDLLLGALAACAQLTCQMVASAMGIQAERIEVLVEGDLDLRGTLGIDRGVPAGFNEIRVRFEIFSSAKVSVEGCMPERLEHALFTSELGDRESAAGVLDAIGRVVLRNAELGGETPRALVKRGQVRARENRGERLAAARRARTKLEAAPVELEVVLG